MLRLGLALASCQIVTAAFAPAMAQEAAQPVAQELVLARQIVEYGFPPETRMDVFGAVMNQVVAQLNAATLDLADDPEISAIVTRFQNEALSLGMATLAGHMDGMMEGMAVGYAESFSLPELQALHAYVSTPEGHGFMAKTAAVNSHPAMVAASQGFINEYLGQVPALQQDLRAELTEVLERRAAE